MMATQWYCMKMGTELGPYSESELVDMIRRGQVDPEDLVRNESCDWTAVFATDGLMDAAAHLPDETEAKTEVAKPHLTTTGKVERVDDDALSESLSDWFCIANGEKHGPISFDELKRLANDGKLRSKDRVWRTSRPRFERASNVEGLSVQ